MTTLFAFIIVLGVLIFVHELGHFLFAKFAGVKVLKFSLGFGPALLGKKWGDTEYVLSAIPLGGYVKMFGENPDEQEVAQEEQEKSFSHKTVWQRFLIIFAGPFFNILFAFVLFFVSIMIGGVPMDSEVYPEIGRVVDNSAAAGAGMQTGDIILGIDDNAVEKWEDVPKLVGASEGKALLFQLKRDGRPLSIEVTPKMTELKDDFGQVQGKRYLVGIEPRIEVIYKRVGIIKAATSAAVMTWDLSGMIIKGVKSMISGDIPASQIGGPILIAQESGKRYKQGWQEMVFFMALISINLGLLNLLPVPVLDGGHLFFLAIEAVRRKPMNEKMQMVSQQIGLGLLLMLMVFAFYNDIVRVADNWQQSKDEAHKQPQIEQEKE